MPYQEYPRHLHKPGGVYKVVDNDADKDAALADGWRLRPGDEPAPEPEPAAAAAAEPDLPSDDAAQPEPDVPAADDAAPADPNKKKPRKPKA